MTSQGDDCYFFFYSTCSKGDACPFRHCEEALGNETVCNLWKEERCFRELCCFRHMDIKKDRSNIPCYWENQPGGCQKSHCVFKHLKSDNQGSSEQDIPLPSSKLYVKTMITPKDSFAKTSIAINRPLRRVSSDLSELSVPVDTPSPQVEPVVVNFEDESDQESPSGTPVKQIPLDFKALKRASRPKIVSLQHQDSANRDDDGETAVNWDVKSLDDIQEEELKKAKKLLAEADSVLNQSLAQHSSQEMGHRKTVMVNKPGIQRRIIQTSSLLDREYDEDSVPVRTRRDVMSRLGAESYIKETRTVQSGILSRLGAQKSAAAAAQPVRVTDRLGLSKTVAVTKAPTTDSVLGRLGRKVQETTQTQKQIHSEDGSKTKSEVRIKTLDEIKHEKAKTTNREGISRIIPTQKRLASLIKRPLDGGSTTRTLGRASDWNDIPVKSLEEIRREKAVRLGQSEPESLSPQPDSTQSSNARNRLALKRTARQERKIYMPPGAQKPDSASSDPVEKAPKVSPSKKKSSGWGVKTYSEIMREKQLKRNLTKEQKPDAERQNKRPISSISFAESVNTKDRTATKKSQRTYSPISFTVEQNVMGQNPGKEPKKKFVPIVFDLTEEKKTITATSIAEEKERFSPIVFDAEGSEKTKTKPTAGGKRSANSRVFTADFEGASGEPPNKRITAVSPGRLDISITTDVGGRSVTSPRENVLSPKLKSPNATGRRISSTSFGTSTSQEVAIAKAVQQRTVSSTSDNGYENMKPNESRGRRLSVRRSTSNEARLGLNVMPISSSTRATGKGDEANTTDNDSFLDEELDDLLGDITSLPIAAAHDSPQTEAEDDALLLEMEELLS